MLHTDVLGEGPDLVLVHGWGMHSAVWWDWAQALGRAFRVTMVDLPGHGDSEYAGDDNLANWAEAVLAVAPARAWWLGWSLGGLVALSALERARQRVQGLVLLASNPKFVSADDWAAAVAPEVFDQFAHQLQADVGRALTRFLALQVRGSDGGGEALRRLRSLSAARGQADARALQAGLAFLKTADLRAVAAAADVPLCLLLGERDTLVPVALQEAFADVPCRVIEGAGHAPFLSHPDVCSEQLKQWIFNDAREKISAH